MGIFQLGLFRFGGTLSVQVILRIVGGNLAWFWGDLEVCGGGMAAPLGGGRA